MGAYGFRFSWEWSQMVNSIDKGRMNFDVFIKLAKAGKPFMRSMNLWINQSINRSINQSIRSHYRMNLNRYTYIHTYMHACMHTYICTYKATYLPTYIRTYRHTDIQTITLYMYYSTVHYIAFQFISLHHSTLTFITFPYMTLHYSKCIHTNYAYLLFFHLTSAYQRSTFPEAGAPSRNSRWPRWRDAGTCVAVQK